MISSDRLESYNFQMYSHPLARCIHALPSATYYHAGIVNISLWMSFTFRTVRTREARQATTNAISTLLARLSNGNTQIILAKFVRITDRLSVIPHYMSFGSNHCAFREFAQTLDVTVRRLDDAGDLELEWH